MAQWMGLMAVRSPIQACSGPPKPANARPFQSKFQHSKEPLAKMHPSEPGRVWPGRVGNVKLARPEDQEEEERRALAQHGPAHIG